MKIIILSALIVISQFWCQGSCSCAGGCCRTIHRCSEVPNYLNTYSQTNCKGIHIRDGLQAQITFMHQQEVKESFRPSYNGGNVNLDVDTFSAIVKSLIEVIRMKKVYQQFSYRDDDHYQAMAQILAKVAEESCLWLQAAGVTVATQNCTNINSTLLEEVYSRLNFYDAISDAESSILRVYPHLKFVNPIEVCAWMNGRVLDNCNDSETYNETVRDTLNNFCRRMPCNPQICQLN